VVIEELEAHGRDPSGVHSEHLALQEARRVALAEREQPPRLEKAVEVGELPADAVEEPEEFTVDDDAAMGVQKPAQEVRAGPPLAEEDEFPVARMAIPESGLQDARPRR
jgi:hypothetical protein